MEKIICGILQPQEYRNYTLLIESQKIFELVQHLHIVSNGIALSVEKEIKRRENHKRQYLEHAAILRALYKQELPFFLPLRISTKKFSQRSLHDLFEFFSKNKEYFEKTLDKKNKKGNIEIFAQSGLIFLGLTFCWYGLTHKFPAQDIGVVGIVLYSLNYLFCRLERNSLYKKGLEDLLGQSEASLRIISEELH